MRKDETILGDTEAAGNGWGRRFGRMGREKRWENWDGKGGWKDCLGLLGVDLTGDTGGFVGFCVWNFDEFCGFLFGLVYENILLS